MFRVLMNLLRNGAEALETTRAELGRPKRIRVESWLEDKTAVIEVADTGPGVPASARARLFTAFSSSRSGGSGLGLVIAIRAIQPKDDLIFQQILWGGDIGAVYITAVHAPVHVLSLFL